MAIIKIQNAIIERVFSGGKGYAVAEEFETRAGEKAKKPYTLWFDEPQSLEVGQRGSFSGIYSDKIEEYERSDGETGRAIRRNLNSARTESVDELVSAGSDSAGF